jgi:tetratricopeptide (TPR) repeat protein
MAPSEEEMIIDSSSLGAARRPEKRNDVPPLSPHTDTRREYKDRTMLKRTASTSYMVFQPALLPDADARDKELQLDNQAKRIQQSSFNTATTQASSLCASSDGDDNDYNCDCSIAEVSEQQSLESLSFEAPAETSSKPLSPKVVFAEVTLSEAQQEASIWNRKGTRYLCHGKDEYALECYEKSRQVLDQEIVAQQEVSPCCPFIGQELTFGNGDDASESGGEDDDEYGFFFDMPAPCHSYRGINVKALDQEKTLLCNPNDQWGMSVLLMSETLNNIATVHWRQGRCEDAMMVFQEAYEAVRETSATSSMPRRSSATSLLSLAGMIGCGSKDSEDKGQPQQPLRFPSTRTRVKYSDTIEQALTQCEIKTLKGIGTAHSMVKDYASAVNSFIQALRLHRRTRLDRDSATHNEENELLSEHSCNSEDHLKQQNRYDLEMSFIVSMIASVYVKCGEYDGALTMYQDVLDIKKSVLGKRHASVAVTYVDIAHVYFHKENYDSAMMHYLKAAKMQERLLSRPGSANNDVIDGMEAFSEPMDIAMTWHHIGHVYFKRGDFEDALNVYREVKHLYLSQGITQEYKTMIALLRDTAEASMAHNKCHQKLYVKKQQQASTIMNKLAAESWSRAKQHREHTEAAPLWGTFLWFRAKAA